MVDQRLPIVPFVMAVADECKIFIPSRGLLEGTYSAGDENLGAGQERPAAGHRRGSQGFTSTRKSPISVGI